MNTRPAAPLRISLPGVHRAAPVRAPSRSSRPAEPRRVCALEFVRRMSGTSQPSFMRCDDGENYVVKFQNNPQHVRILANEMLASRLALLIGLLVPMPAFVEVPSELISGDPFVQFEMGRPCHPCAGGLQFGSRFPGAPGETLVVDFLPDPLLRRVKNLASTFLGGLVFDKWTCNCDRRQVIFYRSVHQEDSTYWAALIDQGSCFSKGDWSFPDSPICGLYPRWLVYESVRGLRSFEPFLSRVEDLDASSLEECVRTIPVEWCGDHPEQIWDLAQRLYDRRRHVRQLIVNGMNTRPNPFRNWQ